MKKLLLIISLVMYMQASEAFITSDDLKSKLEQKNLVLLDVTDSTTYAIGHIPNAINVNVFDFRKNVEGYQLMKSPDKVQSLVRSFGVNNDSEVIIYGHGKPKELLKSSYIATALLIHGVKKVSILDGAYSDWLFEYKELTSIESPTLSEGNFLVKYNPNILVDRHYVSKQINKVAMLEARPERYFTGEDQSRGVRRLGHIPHAISSFWKDKFNSDDSIMTKDELHEIFIKNNKLDKNKEVISYCTGGLEASMNWYVLSHHLGFKDVKLYDGSMREWGNRDDTPMRIGH